MKKLLAVLLTLALLCCGAMAESADITGMWYGDLYGMVATLVLNADSTYSIEILGSAESGAYSFDGTNITFDSEETAVYDAASQTIALTVTGSTIVFGREPIEVYAPAAVRTDSALEEFAGTWETFRVSSSGIVLDPEALGIDLDLTIEDVNVTMIMNNDEAGAFTLPGVLEEGALIAGLSMDAGDGSTASVYLALRLLEDGVLAADLATNPEEGESLTFFMTRVTEEIPAEELPAE